ncbi:MORN repeat protein [Mariniflexile fucanivorans]|uniref:MORN repeat protein n=1 Tax=Mariniflexile fucanivorans TaxID=264023 RepID=A0A4R1RNV0_9FLAO|nr:toxin-antitoxin system YwqK family antitoxin [Mariniflexile fucanivorans]TCL68005.1 MORN repeat protein [Mariniflexile fucanivorans]
MKTLVTALFLLVSTLLLAQEINQLDANGKNHGVWKKNFENTKVLRYEGAFSHGKEIGLFKFYKNIKNKAVLTATKEFNENNNKAYVKFFTSTGKVVSEGLMDGKKYIGEWKYYQKTNDKLLTLERYNDFGILHGERTVYYPNGQIAEKQTYKNGKLDGVSVVYSNTNVLLSEVIYVNGELHGYSKYYSPKAELVAEGLYKNDKKDGIWKYYKDGKLTEEKDFTYIPQYIKKTP